VLAVSEEVALHEEIPLAGGADLHHVDREFPYPAGQGHEFRLGADSAGVLAELIPICIGEVDEAGALAGRARLAGGFTVELGRLDQVGIGLAVLAREHPSRVEILQGGAALQGVVNMRPRLRGMRDEFSWR